MPRREYEGRAIKGSQLHLQNLINDNPEYLNYLILTTSASLRAYATEHPVWVSPLKSDNYKEYQDIEFLNAIGHPEIKKKMAGFWPSGGPVWDALAKVKGHNSSGIILLEAKSHAKELSNPSYACGASRKSLDQIKKSLSIVKRMLKVKRTVEWLGDYYQYANRIAHLYFLTIEGQVPTWLVYLYFVGDAKQKGPSTVVGWNDSLATQSKMIGLE